MEIVHWKYEKKDWNLEKPKTDKKTVLVVRYGGIGDMFMITPFIHQLHDKGYHISVLTTNKSVEVFPNNPYIDRLVVHERHTMLDSDLKDIRDYIYPMYDYVVDTTFTVESTLLFQSNSPMSDPSRIKERRNKVGHINYLDAYRQKFLDAGLEVESGPVEFYPNRTEKKQANRILKKAKGRKVLYWVLTGSSVHKVYPYVANVIAAFLERNKDWVVMTTGDKMSKMGEGDFNNLPKRIQNRIIHLSGRQPLRISLTLCQMVDIVIGPETGLLNASANLPIPKIVLISHSNAYQLCHYWDHTRTINTKIAKCHPCHILHSNGFQTCYRDNATGAALCMSTILPDVVLQTIEDTIDEYIK